MALPTDEKFADQWYLNNVNVGQLDINILKAWQEFSGKGVHLVVMDDGVDHLHPDLSPNYDLANDLDTVQDDNDAMPPSGGNEHGTSVAGIAAGALNGTGIVGVAYGATLSGYRIDFSALQFVEALDLARDSNEVDTINMSFGIGGFFSNDTTVPAAIESAAANGRDGLGTLMIMAGGNTRQYTNQGQINGRTFDSQTEMICVAAVDQFGDVTSFSSYGATNLVSAFGTGLMTTDRLGNEGYSADEFNPSFAGTSGAAPQVTGVTALMLEANPDLGWRDVQSILAYSARHVGSDVGEAKEGHELYEWHFNAARNWNLGGLHYSQDYGYGLVDATAAVRLAESWNGVSTSDNQVKVHADLLNETVALADANSTGETFSRTFNKSIDIERVGIELTFTARPADLVISLTGPNGKQYEFVSQAGTAGVITRTFEFESQQYRGVDSKGEWTVRVADVVSGNAASISDLKLNFYGAEASANDTYFFSDEYSDYVGTHSRTLRDRNGGVDWINASQVTSASKINLLTDDATIDNVAVDIKGTIERLYGGDGNDRFIGSSNNEYLAGGRGADFLKAGAGADRFVYRSAFDSTEDAYDKIARFSARDLIDLKGIDTRSDIEGDQAFKFSEANALSGVKGQLITLTTGGKANPTTLIIGDIDGDGHRDFFIEVTGHYDFHKADFLL